MKRSEIVEKEAVKLTCEQRAECGNTTNTFLSLGKIKFNMSKKVQAGQDVISLRDYGDFAKMVFIVPS